MRPEEGVLLEGFGVRHETGNDVQSWNLLFQMSIYIYISHKFIVYIYASQYTYIIICIYIYISLNIVMLTWH